ncbi:formimidoylglutamate deiminase [Rubrimonas cliftonensis]|uniref:Formimidoylglutamate deiminase n=1 Tax=Rubrimonas cliftonensis TaxID=89524 RepID=A0A1H4CCR5_9RHOB|nr:formimidoylglutamate deiminase [Rubrimonas cliftonensis]SEA58166.1 formimidoylglutamate deiminase [Rubrimonas cliftonensis]
MPSDAVLQADHALTPSGWARDVRATLAGGRIVAVEAGAPARPGDLRLPGRALLPAPANLHSHAFQRAMAGMTARRGPEPDSFWTWRRLMYRFLDLLTPQQIEAIAALVQIEMLEAGYAASAEFHYVHHQPGGAPYADRGELAQRIAAAAADSGIGLTLLPVLYSHGGAGAQPLAGGQLRFGNELDGFAAVMESAARAVAALPDDARLGAAPHSLRATRPEQLRAVAEAWPDGPLHIHAAEQVAEVEQVEAWLGARPVAFLLDGVGMDARWCLIHCTQMTHDETARIAASGAVAGLCPITESDLGDGIFEGDAFRRAGGAFGVGSDSDIRITLADELRTLEYSQRLAHRARNVLAEPGASVGETLYRAALAGGAQALGRASGALAPGMLADLVAIDVEDVALAPLTPDQWIDGWIFAAGDRVVREVWSAGRHVVTGGRHVRRAPIEARYRAEMAALSAAL